jgi:hypothetical protein
MVPVPAPAVPEVLANAKETWSSIEKFLGWFTKIVGTSYTYSDLIVKIRQDKANHRYKVEKAETKAREIMAEQEKKEGTKFSPKFVRRSHAERLIARASFLEDEDLLFQWLE